MPGFLYHVDALPAMQAWAAAIILLGPVTILGENAEPASARWWETTLADADGDRVDDALARLDPRAEATLLAAFDRVPTTRDRQAVEAAGFRVGSTYLHFDVVAVRAAPAEAPRLLQVPGVVFVEHDMELRPLLAQSVPLVGAPLVWKELGATGTGVTIAVLDDGAYGQHPGLAARLRASYDASRPAGTGAVGVAGSTPVVPAGADGHGTHVAGTIVGTGAGSDGRYRGVAPDARFVDVKVFTAPNRTSSEVVLRGLDWTLANADALGVRVVSMSIGGAPSDGKDALSRAVNVAVDDGLVVVAAAGNAGPGSRTIGSPGAAEKAITVGAVDKRKALAAYSSRGPTTDGRQKPDIVAPGTAIVSAVPPASTTSISTLLRDRSSVYYGELSGTSMAAPHVSGVVALMLEVGPDLEPGDVKRILVATAQDLGPAGPDNETGFGFVNAIAAAKIAQDPALLGSPQFAAVLGALPVPQEESYVARATVEWQRAIRSGDLWLATGISLAIIALVLAASLMQRRRA